MLYAQLRIYGVAPTNHTDVFNGKENESERRSKQPVYKQGDVGNIRCMLIIVSV